MDVKWFPTNLSFTSIHQFLILMKSIMIDTPQILLTSL
jgi:hypothetical protein